MNSILEMARLSGPMYAYSMDAETGIVLDQKGLWEENREDGTDGMALSMSYNYRTMDGDHLPAERTPPVVVFSEESDLYELKYQCERLPGEWVDIWCISVKRHGEVIVMWVEGLA